MSAARRRRGPRTTYHHGDLSNALLGEAIALLEEVGIERFTLREVARRAGVNHRAAYRHFADKRALLAAIAQDGYRALAERLREAVQAEQGGAVDRLVAVARTYVELGVAQRARYEVMLGPRLNEDGRFPDLEAAIERAVAVIADELSRAAPGAPPDRIRDAGIGLFASAHGLVQLVFGRRLRVRPELVGAYAERVLRPVVAGIVTDLADR
jgi:AcrR family transcriptional regulator